MAGLRLRIVALLVSAAVMCVACLVWVSMGKAARSGFQVDRAVAFAKLAGAAYCSQAAVEAWTCGEKCIQGIRKPVRVCAGTTTQAFVTSWERRGLVAFQGTKQYQAMLQDLRASKAPAELDVGPACPSCRVHTGFLEEWKSLRDCVKASLREVGHPKGAVAVTGHSLGGAVAVLAMMDLAETGWRVGEAYTFGMPRVGDAQFSQAAEQRFQGVFHRVTHHMDPVPHLPPYDLGYAHVAPEVFFDGDGAGAPYRECAGPEDVQCAGQYSNVVIDLIHIGDHMNYLGVDTGSTGCQEPRHARTARPPESPEMPGPAAPAELVV